MWLSSLLALPSAPDNPSPARGLGTCLALSESLLHALHWKVVAGRPLRCVFLFLGGLRAPPPPTSLSSPSVSCYSPNVSLILCPLPVTPATVWQRVGLSYLQRQEHPPWVKAEVRVSQGLRNAGSAPGPGGRRAPRREERRGSDTESPGETITLSGGLADTGTSVPGQAALGRLPHPLSRPPNKTTWIFIQILFDLHEDSSPFSNAMGQ